jgi:2-polyprenyl-3-methyl-5-hydroxy-6-metoxy-1,4-benzoquinol methylase
MNDTWLQGWNNRYRTKEFAYGTQPNEFLKTQLAELPPGTILFGAEGEGRNAVYAAQLGWQVSAFDISIEGQKKALQLAEDNQVSIDYRVGQFTNMNFPDASFDAIALIYAHFPPNIRTAYHRLLNQKLKKGGILIFEGFGEHHLAYRHKNPKVGGPPNQELLFSMEELQRDFPSYDIRILEETVIELNEGQGHVGTGSVVRFVGIK